MTFPFAAIRALHFVSLMTGFGVAAFLCLLRGRGIGRPPERVVNAFFPAAATLALATAIAWFFLVTGNMAGDWHAGLDPAALKLVAAKTEFGRIAAGRLLGLVLFLILCWRKARTEILAVLAGALLGTLGATSHAAAAAGGATLLRAGNDAVHLLAAGFWIGGLLVLAVLTARDFHQPQKLVAPFRLFSRFGTVAVALLVLSGIVNAASILPVHAINTANAYADILAVKIALALAMIALAAANRLQLVPALGVKNGEVTRQLAFSVLAEIVLGAAIIAIVGYLGQMPPG